EVVEPDLFDKPGAVEHMPHFFRKTADHEMTLVGQKRLLELLDRQAHRGVHVVDVVEAEHDRLDVRVGSNRLKRRLKYVSRTKIEIARDADNPHLSMDIFFGTDRHEA